MTVQGDAMAPADPLSRRGQRWFSTTHWSMVLKAGSPDDAESREALATLCQAYWSPVYSFIRQRERDRDAAMDLTQGFFAALLEKGGVAFARRERGRFRSFLLTSVKNFLANEQDALRAQKRGGGQAPISIDGDAWESSSSLREPATEETPETSFEKQWALTLLDRAMIDLEKEMESSGGLERYRTLKSYLISDADPPYEDLARDLTMTEEAVRVALHRMRRRFGTRLREQVAQTVDDPAKTEDELRYLIELVGR